MKADANKSLLLALITVFVCPVPVQADEIANGYTPAAVTAVSNVVPAMRGGPVNRANINSSAKGSSDPYTGNQGTDSPIRSDPTPDEDMQQIGNPGDESAGPSNNEDDGSSNIADDGSSNGGDRSFSSAGDRGFAGSGDPGFSDGGDRGFAGGGDHGFSNAGDHGFSDAGDHGFSNTEDDRSLKDEGGDSSGPGSSDDD